MGPSRLLAEGCLVRRLVVRTAAQPAHSEDGQLIPQAADERDQRHQDDDPAEPRGRRAALPDLATDLVLMTPL